MTHQIYKSGKILGILFTLILCVLSCVKDDEYDTPKDVCADEKLEGNTTFEDVKALYQGEILQIHDDLILEGYVVSEDKTGNIFGSLHFQDHPTNPTQGLQIDLDIWDLYLSYGIGQKIFIKLKGLYLDNDKGTFKLGGVFSAFGNKMIGRLPVAKMKEHLFVSCESPVEIKVKKVNISELDSTMTNTLVTLQNVELSPESLCKNYAEPEETTDHELNDCKGNTVILRNSGYADFYAEPMPIGNGSIIGVLTRERDDFVLTIRDTEDVNLNGARCGGVEYTCETPEANTTLQQIKEIYQGEPITINDWLVVSTSVVANDASGNFSREIYLQDETGGVKVLIGEIRIHERGFQLNRKIVLAAKGLVLDKTEDGFVLSTMEETEISGVEEEDFYRFFYMEDEQVEITPELIEVPELTEEHIGSLISFKDVQFEEETTFVVDGKDTYSTLTDCYANELVLKTRRQFENGDQALLDKNGTITGILTYDDDEYRLMIRNLEDVNLMTEEKCNVFDNASAVTIDYLATTYAETSSTVEENIKIRGIVTSSAVTQNIRPDRLVLQDETAGIAVVFDETHNLTLNEEIEVALLDAVLENTETGIIISDISADHVISQNTGISPTPVEISIDEVFSGDFYNQLVQIPDLQFKDLEGSFATNTVLTTCTEECTVELIETATFANDAIPDGKGTLTGIPIDGRFYVRDVSDFASDQPYEDCSLRYTNEFVFISEIADPDNSMRNTNMRFIELYNSSSEAVDLTNWTLRRYTNDNTAYTESRVIDLSAYVIPPQSTFVIAASAEGFEATYGFAPDMQGGSGGAADSNGDDNIELVDGNGMVVDLFGVPGEKGRGTNHEFEDGRALRNPEVTQNNAVYTFSEWTIYNDTGDAGTTNQPQIAPEDFSPGVW
ncbi:DUF5689 domain-containing protein [Galbibacter sp. EGI 63066]|uniref:DUF5689 domain-containing protein n=1 Tax=Galbibacter sp. EGI 63066 TaxID=2993559 RepID=UPI0022491E18|nr:DUF5689 domain-containing protein [Galbibacter sp. EGI 63066]MCX2680543.1 DUF5689 domain-containing protein [Galbibacter sp. EGI 63066]